MTRKEFVRLNMIGGLGLLCYNFMPQNNRFTVEELTGKSRNNIIGKDFKLQKEAYEAFIEMKENLHYRVPMQPSNSFRNC